MLADCVMRSFGQFGARAEAGLAGVALERSAVEDVDPAEALAGGRLYGQSAAVRGVS